jgi:CRP-like cAMP-binding protein
VVRLAAGRVVFHEGDRSRSVYVIRRGHVFVVAAGAAGHEAIVGLHGPGELVGELAGMLSAPRSATVRAATPVELVEIRSDVFERHLDDHPHVVLAIARSLAAQLLAANRAVLDGSVPVQVRIARRLLELAVVDHEGRAAEVPLQLSQDELAAWVGAARESVARALRDLREAGVVSTGRRTIVVHDVDELRVRALAFGRS